MPQRIEANHGYMLKNKKWYCIFKNDPEFQKYGLDAYKM